MIEFETTDNSFFEDSSHEQEVLSPQIIPVASGKGGVGKTLVSVNLSFKMAELGYKVVVIDLDIGSSNLHTYMGIKNKYPGLGEFLLGKNKNLVDYILPTDFDNLSIIPGDQLIPDIANLTNTQKKRLLSAIPELPADIIVLDLGAGSSSLVSDFFLLSNSGIIVTIPTPGAILNAFSLLKTIIYRLFKLNFTDSKSTRFINEVKKLDHSGQFPNFWDVLNNLSTIFYDQSIAFKDLLDKFKPSIILNMVEQKEDIKFLEDLTSLVYKKLIIEPDILGYLLKLKQTHTSIKNRTPFVNQFPDTSSSYSMSEMAQKMVNKSFQDAPLFDVNRYHSSLEEVTSAIRADVVLNPPAVKKVVKNVRPQTRQMPLGSDPFATLRQMSSGMMPSGFPAM